MSERALDRPTCLDFTLPSEDLRALLRLPLVAERSRAVAAGIVWHDTQAGALDGRGLSLAVERGRWRLERLRPAQGEDWPPATPPPLLAEAGTQDALGHDLPNALAPMAAFKGRRRELTLTQPVSSEPPDPLVLPVTPPVTLIVLDGTLRGVTAERPVCRLSLRGPEQSLATLAAQLGQAVRLEVPRASLAAEATALARGAEPPPRRVGTPELATDGPLGDGVAHVLAHLVDVVLFWSDQAAAGASPHPVHQMRVAIRRLRSALSMFRRAVACPETLGLQPGLKDLAARLGAARDWDVFLDGTGPAAEAAFPHDARVAALLRAAGRQRKDAYAALRAYLSGPEFRALELDLACAAALRPWSAGPPEQAALLDGSLTEFAGPLLDRRLKQAIRAGAGFQSLPHEALHELRKDCKRLRYAAEFFAKLYPHQHAARFIKRLAALQEVLGVLNDGAVAAGLMAKLGRTDRSYAAGLVRGFAAAAAEGARSEARQCWTRFRRTEPFWR